MISLSPLFYEKFHCKAGDCAHSCCVSEWDIDVDEETADKYLSTPGPLGEELRSHLFHENGVYSLATQSHRCPFFDSDGLCRLVKEKGEDFLGDICHNHPRFYVYVGDLELCGVGLSCEKSVELLLSSSAPLLFTVEGKDDLWTLADILTHLNEPSDTFPFLFAPTYKENDYARLFSLMKNTDPIDATWTTALSSIEKALPHAATGISSLSATLPKDALSLVYQYILYRALGCADEYGIPTVMEFAKAAVHFILLATLALGDFPEQVRRWSEQIEYDTDNPYFLLDAFSSSPFGAKE